MNNRKEHPAILGDTAFPICAKPVLQVVYLSFIHQ